MAATASSQAEPTEVNKVEQRPGLVGRDARSVYINSIVKRFRAFFGFIKI